MAHLGNWKYMHSLFPVTNYKTRQNKGPSHQQFLPICPMCVVNLSEKFTIACAQRSEKKECPQKCDNNWLVSVTKHHYTGNMMNSSNNNTFLNVNSNPLQRQNSVSNPNLSQAGIGVIWYKMELCYGALSMGSVKFWGIRDGISDFAPKFEILGYTHFTGTY